MLEYSWRRIGRKEKWTVFYERTEPLNTSRQREYCEAYGVTPFPREIQFAPWNGLTSGASKRQGWIRMLETPGIQDEDYIVHCDSDSVFFNDDVLKACTGDFVGFPDTQIQFVSTLGRAWTWYGGSFHAARVSLVKKLAALDEATIMQINKELVDYGFPLLDDSVMSYFFARVGAEGQPLPATFLEGDPQRAFYYKPPRSFSHLNGMWTKFLASQVTGKWDIPDVVKSETDFFKG